ncbi:MAG: amidohydrolase family protein [Rhodopirellula sp.]|nr:amidohydrolase family protein [Rhodopirellula sp.]
MHPYVDHVGLWQQELRDWLPATIFDAHVHLGPPEVMRSIREDRKKLALSTFTSLTWEELRDWYPRLFGGRTLVGLAAFPFPLQEVDQDAANGYMIRLMKTAPEIRGFLLAHPTDAAKSVAAFDAAIAAGVRFSGVKPYFDLLGKSVFETTMPEFIPEALLEFMDRRRLVLMLHTSGRGMGEKRNQDYLRRVLDQYPNLPIVLAHMGRYLEAAEFFAFCDSGLLDYPNVYLETSSATLPEVYRRALAHPGMRDRLVFGTDLPFGLITGVEAWSKTHGAIFITRDDYPWNDPALAAESVQRRQLTYNTYHVIQAIKSAVEAMHLSAAQSETVKEGIFHRNAESLFGGSETVHSACGCP